MDTVEQDPPPTGPEFRYMCSESALADRLIETSGADLRYCEELDRWLIWDGTRWNASVIKVQRALRDTTRTLLSLVPPFRPDLLRELARAERPRSHALILTLAKCAATQLEPEQIDADPMLLNVANGTLDLRNGELRPHSRDDVITHVVPTAWSPTADCPLWTSFISTVCGGDAGLIEYMQKCVGYSITGSVREQVAFLLWGSGANGKSTFLLTLLELLGSYGRAADVDLVTRPSGQEPGLFRSRLVALPEVPDGHRLNESRLKLLTGGDRVVVSDEGSFTPTHKLWLASNQPPQFVGTEHALWRRLRPIPFDLRIDESTQDKDLLAKLRAELPGILRWAVRGCLAWQRHGLHPPARVLDVTAAYRAEQNRLAAFISEKCETEPSLRATARDLYAAYQTWSEGNGEAPLGKMSFGRGLTEQLFEPCKIGPESYRGWRGIALRAAAPAVPAVPAVPAAPAAARRKAAKLKDARPLGKRHTKLGW